VASDVASDVAFTAHVYHRLDPGAIGGRSK
jgi:hypothetical protein